MRLKELVMLEKFLALSLLFSMLDLLPARLTNLKSRSPSTRKTAA
jgi:hypothetical protein